MTSSALASMAIDYLVDSQLMKGFVLIRKMPN